MSSSGGRLVAGVDSSTQATKVLVCAADTGVVVREGRAAHPDATEVHPDAWWSAFEEATADGLLEGVSALGIAAQQHGLVALADDGSVVRPALLWHDTRSAGAAADLVAELGGAAAWAEAVGTVPVAALTVAKLRWLAEHEPDSASRAAGLVLPHDWLTGRLLAGGAPGVDPGAVTTDRGDASGTGYFAPAPGDYRHDLVERALGRVPLLPRVLGHHEAAGTVRSGAHAGMLVGAGTGDNMAAALGLGLGAGDVVVSLGTSGTVFAQHDRPTSDPSGAVAGYADAAGGFLPLVCTLNAARVLGATATLLGTDLAGLDRLAGRAAPGAGGLVLLPYLDGERTPDLPGATGTLSGLTRGAMTAENVARAAVEGMLCGLADGLDALRAQAVPVRRVVLIGGAAISRSARQVAAQVFGVPVTVPAPAEYAAIGAARQAALCLAVGAGRRVDDVPAWSRGESAVVEAGDLAVGERVRSAYAGLRHAVHGPDLPVTR